MVTNMQGQPDVFTSVTADDVVPNVPDTPIQTAEELTEIWAQMMRFGPEVRDAYEHWVEVVTKMGEEYDRQIEWAKASRKMKLADSDEWIECPNLCDPSYSIWAFQLLMTPPAKAQNWLETNGIEFDPIAYLPECERKQFEYRLIRWNRLLRAGLKLQSKAMPILQLVNAELLEDRTPPSPS